jgi:uncharacterized membrane protein (UPF0127 family)
MISNVTKGTTLAGNCRICRNSLTRGIGLMFSKKCTPTVLAFPRENTAAIHTFFVKHYLDILFLNDRWEVVDLVQGLAPRKHYAPKKKAMFVIELPEGSIAKSKTAIGDVVNFK